MKKELIKLLKKRSQIDCIIYSDDWEQLTNDIINLINVEKKKLLIDFARFVNQNELKDEEQITDFSIKSYLKSINYFNEPNEFRAIGNNEKPQEFCETCQVNKPCWCEAKDFNEPLDKLIEL